MKDFRGILNFMVSSALIVAGLLGTYFNLLRIGDLKKLEVGNLTEVRHIVVLVTQNEIQAKIIFSLVSLVLGLILLNQELNRREFSGKK